MKVSICVPVYQMKDWENLTKRNLDSILRQTFQDYEIVVSDDSHDNTLHDWLRENYPLPVIKYFKNPNPQGMPNNSNNAWNNASGDLIKILYQDDYFLDEASLWDMVRHFTPHTQWLVTACMHNWNGQLVNPHVPFYSDSENTIGSPSVLILRKQITDRFDPRFSWVLDLDLYKRLFRKYGLPKILRRPDVVIGIHDGQMTNLLTNQRKNLEFRQMEDKYA